MGSKVKVTVDIFKQRIFWINLGVLWNFGRNEVERSKIKVTVRVNMLEKVNTLTTALRRVNSLESANFKTYKFNIVNSVTSKTMCDQLL